MNELAVTEYKNQRVLTTQQIAEAYGTEAKKITDNFNNNKSRYVEGKHYICLEGEELKQFKSKTENLGFAKNLNKLYLWTEKGAFLHAKSLNTDTAWEVYDRLVDSYFIKKNNEKPLSALDQLRLQSQAIMEVDEKVDAVNKDLQEFKMDLPILGIEIDRITEAVHKRGVNALGGKSSNAYNDRSLRGKVYSDIYRELKRQFGVTTYKAIKRNQCDLAVSIIDEYELPFVLSEEINNCNAQMNMEVA